MVEDFCSNITENLQTFASWVSLVAERRETQSFKIKNYIIF